VDLQSDAVPGTVEELLLVSKAAQHLPDRLVDDTAGDPRRNGFDARSLRLGHRPVDLLRVLPEVEHAFRELIADGIQVSLFIDPIQEQIAAAAALGVAMIELNTAAYSEAVPRGLKDWEKAFAQELDKVAEAAEEAAGQGLRVLAGHGLTYRNVPPISSIPEIEELNIGHNIVSRAVLVGMERAVREMLRAMNSELIYE